MKDRGYTLREALAILKGTLEMYGLDRTFISINSHKLTPAKSGSLARDLIIGGFGHNVRHGQEYKYSHRSGRYSWITVEQGDDNINLFYEL